MTPKQEAFAREYVATGNASEAYRRAYDASGMSVGAVKTEANRLLGNPDITLTIATLGAATRERFMITVEDLTRELEEARIMAMADPKGAAAAVSAIMGKAKLHGLLVDKAENKNMNYVLSDEPMTEDEWIAQHCKEEPRH